MQRFVLAALVFFPALSLRAQTVSTQPTAPSRNARPLTFDIVSIKPTHAGATHTVQMLNGEAIVSSQSMFRITPDGFTATNTNAKRLISIAYDLQSDLISGGPDWIGDAAYDIQAKVTTFDPPDAHSLTKSQRNQMIQSLLANRFHLAIHYETKEAPIYELIATKAGPKLHPATPGDTYPNGSKGPDGISHAGMIMFVGLGDYAAQAVSISNLADFLRQTLRQPVIDKTGLTGKYDFTLQYAPENTPANSAEASGPSIFTAVEDQLGLKLVPTKGPVKVLVIDHIEKPSPN